MRTSQPNSKYVLSGITGKLFSSVRAKRRRHASNIKRVVRWFEKDGDALVGEIQLGEVKLSELQRLFNVSQDNPMYDCYPIKTRKQIIYICRATHHRPLDLLKYDYFLECDAI